LILSLELEITRWLTRQEYDTNTSELLFCEGKISPISKNILMEETMATKGRMNSERQSAILVGILFIIATAFLFIGEAFYNPILGSPDFLENAYPNRTIVVFGILLEFTCVIAIPLIAICIFPILKKYGEALALGYVAFRLLEAVFFMIVDINKLSLISASQGYLNAGGADASFFQNLASSIQSENTWLFSIYVLIFALGALIFYSALYRSNLVPRFISAWGWIAAVIMIIGTVLGLLDVNIPVSDLVVELIFALPIAVNEMVLAIWLIIKGFNPAVLAPMAANE
jgi:hypothetical protein